MERSKDIRDNDSQAALQKARIAILKQAFNMRELRKSRTPEEAAACFIRLAGGKKRLKGIFRKSQDLLDVLDTIQARYGLFSEAVRTGKCYLVSVNEFKWFKAAIRAKLDEGEPFTEVDAEDHITEKIEDQVSMIHARVVELVFPRRRQKQ